MRINVSDCKNIYTKRKKVREELTAMFLEFLTEKFQEEPDDVGLVGSNEIAACVATDVIDGFPFDINIVVSPTVKAWTDNPNAKRPVEAYDRIYEIEEYRKKNPTEVDSND